MKAIRATVILSLFVTFFGMVEHASACSCLDPLPTRAALKRSAAVFVGEVIAKRDVDARASGISGASGFTFRVYRSWKGVSTETVEVGTGTGCAFHFVVGVEYLVYAGGLARAPSSLGAGVVTETAAPPRLWTTSGLIRS